jgi:hypothetical protein
MEIEKKIKKYDETNLVMVEGLGRTQEDICLNYIMFIQEGYSLTIQDVATYLRCTYQHVIDKLVPKVPHIRITEVAKMMLMKYSMEHDDIKEELSSLFYKRLLFHKQKFQEYVCKQGVSIISYKRFYTSDMQPVAVEQIKMKLATYNDRNKGKPLSFEKHMERVMDSFLWRGFKNEPIISPTLENFPKELYSQRDLMEHFRLNYKVEFYRKLDSLGVNKVKLNNMIRYSKNEVEEEFMARMYISAFVQLKMEYGDNYINAIQDRAIELLID